VQRLKEVQQTLILQKFKPLQVGESSAVKRPGEFYKRYRKAEQLPENAKAFYELAGKFPPLIRLRKANCGQH
jgi:RNA polymerase I-specific transcription initiation factor RRN7